MDYTDVIIECAEQANTMLKTGWNAREFAELQGRMTFYSLLHFLDNADRTDVRAYAKHVGAHVDY